MLRFGMTSRHRFYISQSTKRLVVSNRKCLLAVCNISYSSWPNETCVKSLLYDDFLIIPFTNDTRTRVFHVNAWRHQQSKTKYPHFFLHPNIQNTRGFRKESLICHQKMISKTTCQLNNQLQRTTGSRYDLRMRPTFNSNIFLLT